MAKITLYTSGCPRCKTLERRLKEKGIEYDLFADVGKMVEMGFTAVPILDVDGTRMDYKESINWLNERGEQE